MNKLKHYTDIKDNSFGEPSICKVYINQDWGCKAGFVWSYYDFYIEHGNEYIYRFFESTTNCINQVDKRYKDVINEFIINHNIPCAYEIELVDKVEVKF